MQNKAKIKKSERLPLPSNSAIMELKERRNELGDPDYLPHNVFLEETLIYALLTQEGLYEELTAKYNITADDFFNQYWASTFDWIGEQKSKQQAAGFLAYQMHLLKLGVGMVNFEQYTGRPIKHEDILQFMTASAIRKMNRIGLDLQLLALDWRENPDGLSDGWKMCIDFVEQTSNPFRQNSESVQDALRHFQNICELGEYKPDFMRTGIEEFDELAYGIESDDIIGIASSGGGGKTSMMLGFLVNLLNQGKSAVFFSFEMTLKQLTNRLLSLISGINHKRIKFGKIEAFEKKCFEDAVLFLEQNMQRIKVIDCISMDIDTLCNTALSLFAKMKYDCVFIDYFQIIGLPKRYDSMLTEAQDEALNQLRGLRKKLQTPLVIAFQLKKGEKSSRPTIRDVKGSQGIEATLTKCFVIDHLLIRGIETTEIGEPVCSIRDIYCDKNRDGETFKVRLNYNGECYRFSSQTQRIDTGSYFLQPLQLPQSSRLLLDNEYEDVPF